MPLSKLIRKVRGKMPQEDFSILCGVTHQALGQWERGEALPTLNKLEKLAKILKMQYKSLLVMWLTEKQKREGYCIR